MAPGPCSGMSPETRVTRTRLGMGVHPPGKPLHPRLLVGGLHGFWAIRSADHATACAGARLRARPCASHGSVRPLPPRQPTSTSPSRPARPKASAICCASSGFSGSPKSFQSITVAGQSAPSAHPRIEAERAQDRGRGGREIAEARTRVPSGSRRSPSGDSAGYVGASPLGSDLINRAAEGGSHEGQDADERGARQAHRDAVCTIVAASPPRGEEQEAEAPKRSSTFLPKTPRRACCRGCGPSSRAGTSTSPS